MPAISIAQCGESEELEKIKKKVFKKKIKLLKHSNEINGLDKFEREKNLYTFIGAKEEFEKDYIEFEER